MIWKGKAAMSNIPNLPANDLLRDDSGDIRKAVEAAFGPGAFALLEDDEVPTTGASVSADSSGANASSLLESLLREIDAEQLANTHPTTPTERRRDTQAHERYIVFELGNALLAVSMDNVVEIQRLPKYTRIPRVPAWLRGVTNLRGAVISLVDLREIAEMEPAEYDAARRMIVIRSLRADISTGLIVDRVIGIRNISAARIKPFSTAIQSPLTPFLRGTTEDTGRLVGVFDLERFLASETIRQFDTH
jgi:purine-binding chemotaxis protein CheW